MTHLYSSQTCQTGDLLPKCNISVFDLLWTESTNLPLFVPRARLKAETACDSFYKGSLFSSAVKG